MFRPEFSRRPRLGQYEIVNVGHDHNMVEGIRLREDESLLVIDLAMPHIFGGTVRFALKPVSDTEAVSHGLGWGMGETIAVVTIGDEEMLRYSGYLLRNRGE